MEKLENLNLYGCKNLSDISCIGKLSNLQVLNLENIGKIHNEFTPLGQLFNLKKLTLGENLKSVEMTILEAASKKRQNQQSFFSSNSSALKSSSEENTQPFETSMTI